jgi:hypothetical protein
MFPLYLFGFSYQTKPFINAENENYIIDVSSEYVIEENNLTNDNNYNDIELEYIMYDSGIPKKIKYMELNKARKEAINEDKLVLVKIESNNCRSCVRLNNFLDTNENVKNMFNDYIKAVSLNREYDRIPPKLDYIGTPTLFLVKPKSGEILMQLQGDATVEELEESLKMFIYNHG